VKQITIHLQTEQSTYVCPVIRFIAKKINVTPKQVIVQFVKKITTQTTPLESVLANHAHISTVQNCNAALKTQIAQNAFQINFTSKTLYASHAISPIVQNVQQPHPTVLTVNQIIS